MLITKAQGLACRRAAERIAEPGGMDEWCRQPHSPDDDALTAIGWCLFNHHESLADCTFGSPADQSQVLMALLWCAEIAGE